MSGSRVKYGGGSVNALTKDTILRGKGENITGIDYNNIVNNRLIFIGKEFIIEKTNKNNEDITYSNIYFNSNLYYYKSNVDSNFQKILIPELGIIINNNSNISVNFSDGGWTSNYISKSIYTLSEKIGFGTSIPLSTIHIKNNDAKILIDNNIKTFELGYDTNNIFTLGNKNENNDTRHQLKIHAEALSNSLFIDQFSITNMKSISVRGLTNLSSNINIENKTIKEWLIDDNHFATEAYVNEQQFLTDETILLGKGSNITDLDYKKITLNRLIFNSPLRYDYINNTVDADLTLSGWTSNNITNNIYSSLKSKIGIGTSEPLATLHIGTTFFNINNNHNDGTLIISKSESDNINNKNFKIGYDENFNFSFGNYNINGTPIWTKQFYINNQAPEGSLSIINNGNININNSLNINSNLFIQKKIIFNNNYNLNINDNNNFSIADNIIINNRLNTIGIGIDPDDNYKLIINGDIKSLSDFYGNDIYANNLNISNLTVINNINVSNIDTNIIRSSNINNINLITTQNINANTIVSSNNIIANNINTRNNINCSNIICSNNLNINRILTANIINASNTTIYNILTSRIINVSSNLTVSSNIITSNLNTIILNVSNINSSNIETTNINIRDKLLTNTINSDFIINKNNILTNKIFSSNIDSLYIDSSNINASNINIIDTLNTDNINSSYIINNNKILSNDIEINNQIICKTSITTKSLNTNNIYISDKIGINILEPLAELHITKNTTSKTNTSIIITGNSKSFKIGYNNSDQFLLGSYNTVNKLWKKHILINNDAPDNTLIIKNSGNISIGTEINTTDIYKLNVVGDLNAINIYENGVKILNNNSINEIINTKLESYLTIINAENTYTTKFDVDNSIADNVTYIEDLVSSLFSKDLNVYSSQKRYPVGNIYNYKYTSRTIAYYENENIYGFMEQFKETIINNDNTETIINYTIYYSSTTLNNFNFNIINKYNAFLYISQNKNLRNSLSWGADNYVSYYKTDALNQINIENLNKNKIITQNQIANSLTYYGDFIIIKYDFNLVLSKFRFYVINDIDNYKIPNAPSLWKCYGSNDAAIWTEIISASNDVYTNALRYNSYIDTLEGYAYYERKINIDIPYKFFGFVFNKIVNFNIYETGNRANLRQSLELFRIELFGKKPINPIYISSNVLDGYLSKYTTNDYIINNIQTKIECTSPLNIDGNTISIDFSKLAISYPDNLTQIIINYINSKTDKWLRYENSIYYINGSVGIGTTNPNPNLIANLKLNVNGSIITSNINNFGNINNIGNISASGNITAVKYYGDGSSLFNIYYNNILSKPNLENLNNWKIYTFQQTTNCYNSLNGNIGIGYVIGETLTSKLSVNGNIYSTGNINAINNLQENSINLSDKYLNINGGKITGFIGIGTDISEIYRVNINGNLNTTSLYINETLINFQNYVQLSYLNTFIQDYSTNTNLNNKLLLYSKTGEDPNYLKLSGGIVQTDTIFLKNVFTSNLISSNLTSLNIINTSNLFSSNITALNQINTSNLISSNLTALNQINTSNLISSNLTVLNQINTSNLISSNLTVLNQINIPNIISSNLTVLNQINTSNLISSNLTVSNQINTPNLISSNLTVSNQINTSNIFSSNLTVSNQINTSNLISSNLTALNQINTSNIISSNLTALNQINTSNIICYNLTALNQINTPNIISSNLTALNQINTSNLISSNLTALNQINTSNIISSNLTALNQIRCINLISSNITALNLINTSNLISSNITSLNQINTSNLVSSNITALNLINTSNLISSNLTVSNLINTPNIISSNIYVSNQINTSNLISSNLTVSNLINTPNIISSNIYVSNQINTSNIISSNIYVSNQINTSNLISSNIYVSNQINTSNIISSNLTALNQINTSNIISSNLTALNQINTPNIISSNITALNQFNTSNIISYNLTVSNLINTPNLISSNITALNQINTSNLISSNITALNQINTSNFISSNLRVLNQINTSNLISSNITSLNQINTSNLISSNLTSLNQINTSNLISSNITSLNQINTSNLISSNITSLNQINTSNLISFNIYNSNLLSSYSIYNINNIGIGDNPSSLYKLNVKGTIYSSNDIICDGNIKEDGIYLKDKYLSINDATNFINTDVLRNELSSNQPNVQKKYGFRCICRTDIILNNETYYKHDVNLSLYIKSKIDSIDANPYRIFGLKCFSTSAIFNNRVANKPPNILQYDIYTSHIINTNTINICAIGFPSNYYLNRITAGDIFLLKTNNYNYISILSRTSNLSVSCIISDFLF